MIAASVGFQCPDDVRAGQAGVRRPRRPAGRGELADSRLTLGLVAVNVLLLLAQQFRPELVVQFGNLALGVDRGDLVGVAQGEWYRLLTAAFLHAGLLHLMTNMFALAMLGPQLEAALGRARFLGLYLLSALGGSTLSFVTSEPGALGVGASGAIFGLFGAFYVVVRRTGGSTGPVLALLAVNLAITFAFPDVIDWRAHLGGLATGAVVAGAFTYAARRTAVQAGVCAAVLVGLLLAVLARAAALQG